MYHSFILLIAGLFSFSGFTGQSSNRIGKTGLREQPATAQSSNKAKSNPQLPVPVFSAVITEKRTADNGTGDAVYLQRFNHVAINDGNVFNAYAGTFTVPADGLYHFSGYFLIDDYQCWTGEFLTNPVSFDVTMVKNNTNIIEMFKFPVIYNAYAGSTGRPTATGQEFNLLLKLQAGETIRLKVKSKKCDSRNEAFFSNVIFSGFKVY